MKELDAEAIIATLGLEPHPEGGWFAETWRAPAGPGEREAGTAIYFLLREGESSAWHRVDAAEIWHHYAGSPLELSTWTPGAAVRARVLGSNLSDGERPQWVVAANEWQSARTLGSFTLVGCTVSPAFRFEGFEMAPVGWTPESA